MLLRHITYIQLFRVYSTVSHYLITGIVLVRVYILLFHIADIVLVRVYVTILHYMYCTCQSVYVTVSGSCAGQRHGAYKS